MTQRIFRPLDNEHDRIDLFNLLPDCVEFITFDIEKNCGWQEKPYYKNSLWMTSSGNRYRFDTLAIGIELRPYSECIIERPAETKWFDVDNIKDDADKYIGKLVMLKNNIEDGFIFPSILKEIDYGEATPFIIDYVYDNQEMRELTKKEIKELTSYLDWKEDE